jgi:hypothetical protein
LDWCKLGEHTDGRSWADACTYRSEGGYPDPEASRADVDWRRLGWQSVRCLSEQFRKVCAYIDEGIQRKEGLLIFGGLPPKEGPLSEGYFAIPTVFADTSNDWRLAREEIFGPVLVAIPWRDEADAIRMANDSHYGLAAYVWTHDIGKALRTAHAIESGWVQVNQGLGQQPGHSYGVTNRAASVASSHWRACWTASRSARMSLWTSTRRRDK